MTSPDLAWQTDQADQDMADHAAALEAHTAAEAPQEDPPYVAPAPTPAAAEEARQAAAHRDQAAARLEDIRVMRDSNRPALIPGNSHMVAGYTDGSWEWGAADWARWDGHATVRITVEPFDRLHRPTGYPHGNFMAASVIDVESKAFTLADAAKFVPQRNQFRPGTATVYLSEGRLGQALRYLRGHHYNLWLAWYLFRPPIADEVVHIERLVNPYGVHLVAWQHTPGPDFDTSVVLDPAWHPDPRE